MSLLWLKPIRSLPVILIRFTIIFTILCSYLSYIIGELMRLAEFFWIPIHDSTLTKVFPKTFKLWHAESTLYISCFLQTPYALSINLFEHGVLVCNKLFIIFSGKGMTERVKNHICRVILALIKYVSIRFDLLQHLPSLIWKGSLKLK